MFRLGLVDDHRKHLFCCDGDLLRLPSRAPRDLLAVARSPGGMLAEIPGRVYMMKCCEGLVFLNQGHVRDEHRVWPSGRIHGAEAMRRKNPCAGSTTVAVTLAVFLLFFTLITLYLFAAK